MMYKFRTMHKDAHSNERIFRFKEMIYYLKLKTIKIIKKSSFLRRYSLDEAHNFYAKGDMSLVGPRPLFEKILSIRELYEKINVLLGLQDCYKLVVKCPRVGDTV